MKATREDGSFLHCFCLDYLCCGFASEGINLNKFI